MSAYAKIAVQTTDQYIAALDQAQDNYLKSFAAFSKSLPPQPSTPGWPTAQEVIEVSFSFAQKMLNQQQRFMQRLMATTPNEVPTASAVAFGKTASPKNKKAN